MKWNEKPVARKALAVICYICVAGYLLLTLLKALSILAAPEASVHALLGVAFLCKGLTQTGKEKIWSFALAAGWFLVALLYCF